MWKIIKNEIGYQFAAIFQNMIFCTIVILIIFILVGMDYWKYTGLKQPVVIVPFLSIYLLSLFPYIYGVTFIYQLIYELYGKRVRIHSIKPLDIKSIGGARLLYPLIIWLICMLVYFILRWISYQTFQWVSRTYSYPLNFMWEWQVNLEDAIKVSMIILYLTFALRTLVERGSRIIGIAFLSILLFWFTVLEQSVQYEYHYMISSWIKSTVHPEIAILLSLIFASLTYYRLPDAGHFLHEKFRI